MVVHPLVEWDTYRLTKVFNGLQSKNIFNALNIIIMKRTFYTLVFCFILSLVYGQDPCRYLEEVFPTVKRTNDIVYGRNATVLYLQPLGEAVPEDLLLDLYEPEGDSVATRPLIIYFHSGNFIPYPYNGGKVGSRKDKSSEEFCTRLAKHGYVVASADYRLGWNPFDTTVYGPRIGIINAAYRGVQDANTCIRFFRKTVAEDGNLYGIDQNRIVLFGDDTGGYLSVHAASLNSTQEIFESDQFCVPVPPLPDTCIPMIAEYVNGDVEAKQFGVNTPPYPIFPFPEGDTLCYANYPEYSSSFNCAVNLGGAVAAIEWLDTEGQIPIINVHNIYDPSTPYDEGVVGVFAPIMYVYGSQSIAEKLTENGVNGWVKTAPDCFANAFQDAVNAAANELNGGLTGLFPIVPPDPSVSDPWVWFDPANPLDSSDYQTAKLYIDSIMAFVLPQMFAAMQLHEIAFCGCVDVETVSPVEAGIQIDPNPASDRIEISSDNTDPMRLIRLYDLHGMLVKEFKPENESHFSIPVNQYPPGMYLIQVQFDDAITTKQIIVQ